MSLLLTAWSVDLLVSRELAIPLTWTLSMGPSDAGGTRSKFRSVGRTEARTETPDVRESRNVIDAKRKASERCVGKDRDGSDGPFS